MNPKSQGIFDPHFNSITFIESKKMAMKKYVNLFLLFFIVLTSGALTSCQEETVQPGNKEGNISGQDDWEKHNG